MKKHIFLASVSLMLCTAFLKAQTTYIPDANFEQALIDLGIDSDGSINQSVSTSDIAGVITLDVSSKNIQDLTGIEDFSSLISLNCSYNQLTSLDITQNTLLKGLICFENQLTSLDVTQNTELEYLQCASNQLTSLDVTLNTLLEYFYCGSNELTSLDVTQNTLLKILYCNTNLLTSLDLTQNISLTVLECALNELTSLDVTQNSALDYIDINGNNIINLDLTQNTELTDFLCNNNQLTCLDVHNGNNQNLIVSCNNNPDLTCINVDDETADHSSWQVDAGVTFSNACGDCPANQPPVAVCKDITVFTDENCEGYVSPEEVDYGSYDPDGDPVSLELDQTGPFQPGTYTVTLTVADINGFSDQCPAIVTVVDDDPPVIITATVDMDFMIWPPNHQYQVFTVNDVVLSVQDNCSDLSIDDVLIVRATSDEPEDAEGDSDGSTLDDIVIAEDCRSVQFRKERDGNGNGRVYTIYFELEDESGNIGYANCQVQVPHNNGGTAIDDGIAYEEPGNCGAKSSFAQNEKNGSNSSVDLVSYPNPFNSAVSIEYTLNHSGTVNIIFYNQLGKQVDVFEKWQQAGLNKALWTPFNLPDGIYYFRFIAGEQRKDGKLLIVK